MDEASAEIRRRLICTRLGCHVARREDVVRALVRCSGHAGDIHGNRIRGKTSGGNKNAISEALECGPEEVRFDADADGWIVHSGVERPITRRVGGNEDEFKA